MKIEVKNLTFGYIKQPLLFSGVTFTIGNKNKVLLLGGCDSGKTTLLNLLCKMEDLYFGNILYNGKNAKEMRFDEINTSLLLNPPVLYERKSVLDNILEMYYVKEEKTKEKRLSSKDKKLIKNAKTCEICEKIGCFLQNIDPKCKISKLSNGQKISVSLLRSMLKESENVFIDDIEKVEDMNLLEQLVSGKTLLATSSTVKDFGIKFDNILYLSFGKIYEYSSLEGMREKRIDLTCANMFDSLVKIDAKITLEDVGYFLDFDDKKYKFGDDYFLKLKKLGLELYDEAEVVFAFDESSEHLFDLIDKKSVSMYEKLTREKIF